MLKALVRWLWPPEAPRTQTEPVRDFITREELELALRKFEERTEFEFGEWYDKFSALHARAEKRVNREKRNGGEPPNRVEQNDRAVSALQFRKPWSV